MTPAARLQAAIEVLDEVIAAARDNGPPADTIVTRYFKQRRYAGSKDRRAVRELVFLAVRRCWGWCRMSQSCSTCSVSRGARTCRSTANRLLRPASFRVG